MPRSSFKLRWRRPSALGWLCRIPVLAIAVFIWINSFKASRGGVFAWPEDFDVYTHKQVNPKAPIILFYWDRLCLNFNDSRMPAVHPGVPIRFVYYVHVSGLDPNPTEPWQFFRWAIVMPTWAASLAAACIVIPLCLPRVFRIRPGFCANCNYNLKGLTATACPECGTVASPGS